MHLGFHSSQLLNLLLPPQFVRLGQQHDEGQPARLEPGEQLPVEGTDAAPDIDRHHEPHERLAFEQVSAEQPFPALLHVACHAREAIARQVDEAALLAGVPAGTRLYRATGCRRCQERGTGGRLAAMEIMPVTFLWSRTGRWRTCFAVMRAMHWPTVKHDLHTGTRTVFDHGPGRAAGEAVFVGRPGSTEEDDGWLVGFVHAPGGTASDLCILDAHAIAAGPIARVHMPRRVPFGFHGNWFAA